MKREYQDYGQYLEDAYEEAAKEYEKRNLSVCRQDADGDGGRREAGDGNSEI